MQLPHSALAGTHTVAVEMAVACMSAFNCNFATLHVQTEADESGARQQVRTLDPRQWQQFLNQHPTSLPAKTTHDRTGKTIDTISAKSKLRNQVIACLHEDGLGWHASVAEQTGKDYVDSLTNVLWGISSWHGVFRERGSRDAGSWGEES